MTYEPTDKVNTMRLTRAHDLLLRYWDTARMLADKLYPVEQSNLQNREKLRECDRLLDAGLHDVATMKEMRKDLVDDLESLPRINYEFGGVSSLLERNMSKFLNSDLMQDKDQNVTTKKYGDYMEELIEQYKNDVDLSQKMQPRIATMNKNNRSIG